MGTIEVRPLWELTAQYGSDPGDANDLHRLGMPLERDEARIDEAHQPGLRRLAARDDLIRLGDRSDSGGSVNGLAAIAATEAFEARPL